MQSDQRRWLLKATVLASTAAITGFKTAYRPVNPNNGMIFDFANLENPEWVKSELPQKLAFKALVGDVFWVRFDDYEPMVNITLEEVITLSEYAFLLRFHTSDSRKLTQVTHFIEHATLGSIPMFLVANPITESEHLEGFMLGGELKKASDHYYEAIFDHMPLTAKQKALIPVGQKQKLEQNWETLNLSNEN